MACMQGGGKRSGVGVSETCMHKQFSDTGFKNDNIWLLVTTFLADGINAHHKP